MAGRSQHSKHAASDQLFRVIVAVVTCLGALGFFALIYFPLEYLD